MNSSPSDAASRRSRSHATASVGDAVATGPSGVTSSALIASSSIGETIRNTPTWLPTKTSAPSRSRVPALGAHVVDEACRSCCPDPPGRSRPIRARCARAGRRPARRRAPRRWPARAARRRAGPRYSSSPTICRRARAGSPASSAFPDTSSTARSRCSPGDSGDCTCVSVWSRASAIGVDSSTARPDGSARAARACPYSQAMRASRGRCDASVDAVAELARRVRAPAPDRAVGAARARVRRRPRRSRRRSSGPRRGTGDVAGVDACRRRAGRSRSRPSS